MSAHRKLHLHHTHTYIQWCRMWWSHWSEWVTPPNLLIYDMNEHTQEATPTPRTMSHISLQRKDFSHMLYPLERKEWWRGKALQHLLGATKRAFWFFYIFWNSDFRQRFPLKSTEIRRSRKHRFCVLKFPVSPLRSTRGWISLVSKIIHIPSYRRNLFIYNWFIYDVNEHSLLHIQVRTHWCCIWINCSSTSYMMLYMNKLLINVVYDVVYE